MALPRFIRPLFFVLAKSDLERLIAVPFRCFFLSHKTRPGLNQGHPNNQAVFIKELRHFYFFPQDKFYHFYLKIRAFYSEEFLVIKLSTRLISIDVFCYSSEERRSRFALLHRNTKFMAGNYGGLRICHQNLFALTVSRF